VHKIKKKKPMPANNTEAVNFASKMSSNLQGRSVGSAREHTGVRIFWGCESYLDSNLCRPSLLEKQVG
jgi:hypothetical protein